MRSHLLSSIAALSGLVPQLALRQGLALPALGSARSFAKAADSGAWANLPREVRIVEVGPRDGLQNEPKREETKECEVAQPFGQSRHPDAATAVQRFSGREVLLVFQSSRRLQPFSTDPARALVRIGGWKRRALMRLRCAQRVR